MVKIKRIIPEHVIKLYAEGTFSAAQVAHFVHMSLWSFFALLQEKRISLSYDKEELEKDLRVLR